MSYFDSETAWTGLVGHIGHGDGSSAEVMV
jgi:hypothetical protein